MHVHQHEDEWLVVLEGEMTFYAGDLVLGGGPGTVAYFPRNLPHTFVVETDRARMLVLASPGGFVRMFERAPTTRQEAAAALVAYGADPVGPNPRELR
jgi:quercetin dioxygenase-like cupin family protein